MTFQLQNEHAGTRPSAGSRFRQLMRTEQCVVLPGAYDCISALAIQQAGFPACYMTGAGTAAAMGYPDIGLITLTEMVANASRISNALSIPLISDADTGYGNEVNVARTVMEFERAGVAGIHIEDQVFPKRCGHLDGKVTVGRQEFASKIRAAVAARRDPDFLIIARTDSIATTGLDEAIVHLRLARTSSSSKRLRRWRLSARFRKKSKARHYSIRFQVEKRPRYHFRKLQNTDTRL